MIPTWLSILAFILLLLASGAAVHGLRLRRREAEAFRRERRDLKRDIAAAESRLERAESQRRETELSREMLERALDMSESSAKAKHQFLADMSHEIRTPLNGVLGMSEVLLSGNLDPQEQKDVVRAMQTSGQALLHLIDDILSLSKLEAGRVELEQQTVNLRSLVEDILESFARDAYEKNIALSASLAHAPETVRIDSLRLRQVLANLIGNALKFTEKGEVMVRARKLTGGGLGFEVRDTGIGIAKDKQAELFESFTQAEVSTTREFGGTGLGLAICRRLVELMDGTIQVQSEPGGGSAFYFHVDAEIVLDAPTEPVPSHMIGRHVVLVDPHLWQRRNLASILAGHGFVVEAFETGADAFGTVTDFLLVSRYAHDPARVVRDLGGGASCFLLASIADPVGREVAKELGFDGILSLPIHQTRLLATLEPLGRGVLQAPESEEAEQLALSLPLRILVAEDNAVNQLVAEEILRVLGYRADIAENGHEVLARLETADYDLIFMDLIMPGLGGLETARRIRGSLPLSRQPRIVALTAGVMHEQRDACREAGMNDFLPKPMQIDATREVLERTMSHLLAGSAV